MLDWLDRRRFGYALVLSIVLFLVGTLIFPVFGDKSGFDIINDTLKGIRENMDKVGDNPVVPEPYIYTNFTPPSNSFGMGETVFKSVNWTYFKELFTSHCSWMLEYKRYSYSDWTDGNEYMTIEKTWNESLSGWKFNLILDAPVDVYSARFTFACDLPVLDYVERDGWQVNLNYTVPNTDEVYNCFFNWSDMADIPGIVFNKGKTDDLFWFRFRRDDIPSGHYEFDPVFGNEESATTYIALVLSGGGVIIGTYASPDSSGTADNITFTLTSQTGCDDGDEINIQAGLYEYVDFDTDYAGNLIAVTEETGNFEPNDISYPYEITLDFASPPSITSGTNYYIVVGCTYESIDTSEYVYLDASAGNRIIEPVYMAPDPLTGENGYTNGAPVIYCSYTPITNIVPEISLNNPSNATIVSSPVNLSITVSDDDGDNMNISWYGDGSLIHTTSSVGNGTYYYDWSNSSGYHTWNVTVGDGTDTNDSNWRWFTIDYFNDTFTDTNNISSSTNMTHSTGYYKTTTTGGSGSITFVSNSSAINDPATTVTITKPDDVQDNDVLFVFLFHDNNDADDEFNTLDGWVEIFNLTDDPSGRGGTTWYGYHIVTDSGSEPADYTFTHTDDTAEDTGGIMVCLRGVDTSDVLANDTGYTYSFQANTGNFLSPDITTDEDNALVLCMGSMSHAQTSCTAPTNTNLIKFVDWDYCNLMIAYYTQENSGATGDKQWTTDGVQEARGGQVAFKPAPASGGSYDSNIQTVNITKNSTLAWDKIYAGYNCSSDNFTISILDNTTEYVILGSLDTGSDISSLTNDTIKILFEIDIACNFTSYNITTSSDDVPPVNHNPTQNNENPSDTDTDISLTPQLYVTCSDTDGDTINATWWSNSSGSWVQFASNNTGFSSGTTIYQTNSNFSSYNTQYWWSVNISDGEGGWTNNTYSFTITDGSWVSIDETINGTYINTTSWFLLDNTINGRYTNITNWVLIEDTINGSYINTTNWNLIDNTINGSYSNTSDNTAPVFSNINPADGETDVDLPGCLITIQINDTEGDKFNYSWACSDGSNNEATGNTNGTKYLMFCMGGLHTFNTTYTWWINATDEHGLYTNNSYSFTTTDGSWKAIDNTINGSYSNTTSWVLIEDTINGSYSNTTNWNLIDNNINGTYTNTTPWILIEDTINGTYTNTTEGDYNPPYQSYNNTKNITITWNITITDDSGVFNWTIECNNTQSNSGNDDSNGSKTIVLYDLSCNTTYTIWVNTTDYSNNWNNNTYSFILCECTGTTSCVSKYGYITSTGSGRAVYNTTGFESITFIIALFVAVLILYKKRR